MKAIVEMTPEEYGKMHEKYMTLLSAIEGHSRSDLITYTRSSGYAHFKFSGTYTDKLVQLLGRHPNEDEIIMLVDSGYCHFGAGCTIDHVRRSFSGRVNID